MTETIAVANKPEVTFDFLMQVLRTTARDNCNDIWWRTDGEYAPVSIFVNCSDLFWWGCADCEELTPDNIDVFEQAFVDVRAAGDRDGIYGSNLFCCRVRGMRPQGCCYPDERGLWPLFNACGPEREVGRGNPYPPGGRKCDVVLPGTPPTK